MCALKFKEQKILQPETLLLSLVFAVEMAHARSL